MDSRSGNMPGINQGNIESVNNPSPQLQGSIQKSPTQHSPMGIHGNKNENKAAENFSAALRSCIKEKVRQRDPTAQLDKKVEDLLILLARDCIDTTVDSVCALAKHTHPPTVELMDMDRVWNKLVPGFGNEEVQPCKRSTMTDAHRQRLALSRKTMKPHECDEK